MEDLKNKILLNADYHTHTFYSHGKSTPYENILRAKELQMQAIAITDHGPHHFIYGVSNKNLIKQRQEIEKLKQEINGIDIYFGVEADIKGLDGKIDIDIFNKNFFDIILCGFHKPVWASEFSDYFNLFLNSYTKIFLKPSASIVRKNTKAYVNTIKNNPIDILTHPNYHLKINCKEVGKCCADYGTFLELSSRHNDLSEADMYDLLATDVKFVLNSDAHRLENIGNCANALNLVKKFSIPEDRIVNCNGKKIELRSKR
ncbi:MAG: PHP domain-containing protein [Clostridia bacterium]